MNASARTFRTYEEWEATVPAGLKDDQLWTIRAYRIALFLADLADRDCAKLATHGASRVTVDQLHRAVGSISASIAEGYGRSGAKDRAHFFEIAMGSARESTTWYFQVRTVLSETVTDRRMQQLHEVTGLLVTMAKNARTRDIRP